VILVRKFSVMYQGEKCQVLYVYLAKPTQTKVEEEMLHYCIVDPKGNQSFIEAQNVDSVIADE
jgi:hypothetical protein